MIKVMTVTQKKEKKKRKEKKESPEMAKPFNISTFYIDLMIFFNGLLKKDSSSLYW